MTRLQRHQQREAKLREQMLAILTAAEATDEGRLTAEQDAAYKALEEQLAAVHEDIQRELRFEQHERSAAAVLTADPARPRGALHERAEDDPRGGFHDLGEFALAVRSACRPGGAVDERLAFARPSRFAAPTNYHQEVGADEGYMVPPDFRQEIWNIVFADDGILDAVAPEPTESNAVDFITDESTPWGSTGIQALWRSEAGQLTPSKLATKLEQVRLYELFAFVLATEELLQDAPRLTTRLTTGAGRAILWKAVEALMWGTGAGQPLGWMKSGALVTQTKEAAQATATLVTKNISKMYARLLAQDGGRPFWVANRDITSQLMELTIGNQPVWTPPNAGFQGAPGGFLLGLPIRWSEHAQTLGTKGDLQLIDAAGYYATVKRGGARFDSSIHLFFDYAVQAFRWLFRIGGQPFLSAPVAAAKGANTKSHFVVLEDRP